MKLTDYYPGSSDELLETIELIAENPSLCLSKIERAMTLLVECAYFVSISKETPTVITHEIQSRDVNSLKNEDAQLLSYILAEVITLGESLQIASFNLEASIKALEVAKTNLAALSVNAQGSVCYSPANIKMLAARVLANLKSNHADEHWSAD